jgi:PAS domain S-box-containing protein
VSDAANDDQVSHGSPTLVEGAVARLLAGQDWTANPLGPPESWPAALKVAFSICLSSTTISAIFWGPDFRLLYNDASIPMLGTKHPAAFGMPAREVWPASWPFLGPQLQQAMRTRREVSRTNHQFAVDSAGRPSEAYFDYSVRPIVDADGKVAGLFGQGHETTPLVLAERWLTAERERYTQMLNRAPGLFAQLRGPTHIVEFLNPAAIRLVGDRVVVGKPLHEAMPELAGQGIIELLDRAYTTGAAVSANTMPALLQPPGGGPAVRHYLDLVFQPLTTADGKVGGIVVQGMDVTDRVSAGVALAESEERFRLLADRAPVMLWMSDMHGKCLYLNRALREFWGVAVDVVRDFDWNITIHPDDIAALAGPWGEGVRTHSEFTVEARYRRHDGLYRTLQTTAHPRFDPVGNYIGMIGVNVDVTATREAEASLRQETRLLELLNRTGAAIAAELELEVIVQRVTDAGVEMTGAEFGAFFYNVRDDNGESYMLYALSGVPREAFSKFPMPRATAIFRPTFLGERVVRSDDILNDPNYGLSAPHYGMPPGHLPVRSYLAIPVISRSGEVLGGLFFGHAQTGVFKAEHERLLTGIAAQSAVAIDNARLLQSTERENARRAAAEESLRELNETLEARVISEIAERHETEAALRQAQKMEAMGQLTGGVAHDFNNLLQVIAGNLQLLEKDVAGNEPAEQRVRSALAGVTRGAKLASQLLAFGRRQALEPRTLNVGRLVAGMEEMLRRTLGEAIEVETVIGDGLWNTLIDPSQMENALLNLAINARDAMENGGKLTIEAANATIDAANARDHPDATPGQYVMLAVTDTGSGISPEIIERVIEPFFSTKPEGKGTGLGLSMVYGFVKQSGGHVRLGSELGRGTTVKLYLPRTTAAEEVLAPTDSGPLVGGDQTILVAEDDDEVRETVVETLSDLGYRVLKAKDAAGALAIIESGVQIDLLFTDVVMPGPLKSVDLARQVAARFPATAVLFTSGYTEDSIVHDGRLDPGVELLPKPYVRQDLARKVRRVLAAARGPQVTPEPEREPAPPIGAAAPQPSPDQPCTVLLVEDEWLIRMNTSDILQGQRHVVIEAGTAKEALAALDVTDFDVLVTDLGLPDLPGAELARLARQRRPGLALVFATGDQTSPTPPELADAELLSKPYDADGLARAIRKARGAVAAKLIG